jgi:hypothetical protein
MTISFALCPQCLARYRALRHEPTCSYSLNIMPLCSPVWPDEHPGGGVIPDQDPNHPECRDSIVRLAAARKRLWRTGAIPEESKELWAEAQGLIPDWPGFLRLSLNEDQRLSLEACAQEAHEIVELTAEHYPQMTFTDKGGGVVEFTAQRPPLLVMEFAKGSARSLALEFYPKNVDAFVQQLPKAKAALLDWKAKNGDRCKMVMFTVVSSPECHTAIEPIVQQACRDEAEWAPLLKTLDVRVVLANPWGDLVKEYLLDKAASANAAITKPWWRFW